MEPRGSLRGDSIRTGLCYCRHVSNYGCIIWAVCRADRGAHWYVAGKAALDVDSRGSPPGVVFCELYYDGWPIPMVLVAAGHAPDDDLCRRVCNPLQPAGRSA